MDTNLEELLAYRPALIVGSTATTAADDRAKAFSAAVKRAEELGWTLSIEERENPGVFFDVIRTRDLTKAIEIERLYKEAISTLVPTLEVPHLATVNWSAIISLCEDTCLEQALQTRLDRTPSSRRLTLVSQPGVQLPVRTIPVFRLLGDSYSSAEESRLALSTSDVLIRKQHWGDLLRDFGDSAKNAVVVVLGVAKDHLQDCLASLLASSHTVPRRFLFVDGAAAYLDVTSKAILRRKAEIIESGITIRQFCETARSSARKTLDAAGPQNLSKELKELLEEYADFLSVPASALPPNFIIKQRETELCDALFRPMSLDWRPFLADFDLPRDQLADVVGEIKQLQATAKRGAWPTYSLKGEAGVGKTTFLKRVAVELAKSGATVFWVRRRTQKGVVTAVREFSRRLKALYGREKTESDPVICICDDPLGLDVAAEELIACFETNGLNAVTVFGLRNSDDLLATIPVWRQDKFPRVEEQLRYVLSTTEQEGLAAFLVKHNMASSLGAAKSMVAQVPDKNANDILCSLWFLIPQTKSQLEASLGSEYMRLGGSGTSHAVAVLAQQARESAAIARRSYEVVAVASSLDLGVPIEVLVAAVAAGSYSDWLDQFGYGKPLWGLLYIDDDEAAYIFRFRTRNSVVTSILIRLVDQGIGHSGRLRVLKELVAACVDRGPVYREFLEQLLIERRSVLEKLLYLDEGIQLYDLALSGDSPIYSALLHHKGIWIRRKGGDVGQAYELMEEALQRIGADNTQTESRENLHTSMAAAVAHQLERGEISAAAALELVQTHLGEARLRSGLDPHFAYLQARTFFEVSKSSESRSIAIQAVCRALSEVDQGLVSIGGTWKSSSKNARGVEKLVEMQRLIFRFVDHLGESESIDIPEVYATQLKARRLLREAASSAKGTKYNEVMELLNAAIAAHEGKPGTGVIGLKELRAATVIRWRISSVRGPVDWAGFRSDLDSLLQLNYYSGQPLWRYYHALATFHLGELAAAQAEFSALRNSCRGQYGIHTLRNFLVGKEGMPKALQATFHAAHGREYVALHELDLDAEVHDSHPHYRDGEEVHCYLVFRFAGYRAYFGRPDKVDLAPPFEELEVEEEES